MIRLADNADSSDIRGLIAQTQGDLVGLDWSDIYPYWLVAEKADKIADGFESDITVTTTSSVESGNICYHIRNYQGVPEVSTFASGTIAIRGAA